MDSLFPACWYYSCSRLSSGKSIAAGDVLMQIASPEFQTTQLDLLKTTLEANLIRQRTVRLQQAGRDAFFAQGIARDVESR